jgi:hypothetical protein
MSIETTNILDEQTADNARALRTIEVLVAGVGELRTILGRMEDRFAEQGSESLTIEGRMVMDLRERVAALVDGIAPLGTKF